MPKTTTTNTRNASHAQVGMLTRAYRELFPNENGRQGITQKELLQRMNAVDVTFAATSSHGTVSRWESGQTPPTVQRLLAFGRALNLTSAEIQGLILIAGLDPSHQETRTLTCTRCGGETETTATQQVARTTPAGTPITSAIRTRSCVDCRHAAQSTERWDEHPEELAHARFARTLQQITKANAAITQVLATA